MRRVGGGSGGAFAAILRVWRKMRHVISAGQGGRANEVRTVDALVIGFLRSMQIVEKRVMCSKAVAFFRLHCHCLCNYGILRCTSGDVSLIYLF